jgi:hypothetical protein
MRLSRPNLDLEGMFSTLNAMHKPVCHHRYAITIRLEIIEVVE